MDRNYFLSYGQIAFLLLLSAIGKLNASIVSATEGKHELLYYVDRADTDFYPNLSDTFSQKLISSLECGSYHLSNSNDYFSYTVFENSLQNHLPIFIDPDFFLPMKDLKSVSVWNKWRILSAVGNTDVLSIIKPVKKFSTNSVKLIDGFKFIIKIPDKLTPSSIK